MQRVKIYSLISILLTFCLMIMGAITHNTASSLACPNWPTCYKASSSIMTTSAWINYSHRMLAFAVFILGFLILKNCWRLGAIRKKAIISFSYLWLQVIVGAIGVFLKLPTLVSVFHLLISLLFLISAFSLYRESTTFELTFKQDNKITRHWSALKFHLFTFMGVTFFLQSLFGAIVKHSGASGACGLGESAGTKCFELNSLGNLGSLIPLSEAAILNMAHRFSAALVLVIVLIASHLAFYKMRKVDHKRSWKIIGLPFLTLLQMVIGFLSLKYNLQPLFTTLHLVCALFFLITFLSVYFDFKFYEQLVPEDKRHSTLSDLLDLAKPKLSLLVISSSFAGLMLAPDKINFFKASLGLIAITLVVAGAAALNCYLEREVDGKMQRTMNRPLPAKRMKPVVALSFGIICSVIGLLILFFYFNRPVGYAAAFASICYVFAYTPLKRKSTLSLAVGAIPGAIPPLLGFLLATQKMDLAIISLFLLIFFWQFPHFFSISIFHQKDYDNAEIKVHTAKMSFDSAQKFILYSTPFVVLISILPFLGKLASSAYLYSALTLGLAFCLTGLIRKHEKISIESKRHWARKYFFASIIYLPLLMFSMVLLR